MSSVSARAIRMTAVTVMLTGAGACTTAATTATSAPGSTAASAPSTAAAGSAATGTTAAGTTAPTAKTTTAAATGGSKSIADCTATDLEISLTEQPQRETKTTLMALMFLENKSATTCRLNGWPAVTLRNAANEVVTVPTEQVNQPGAPTTADVKPGTTAAAGIKWTICEKSDEDCPVGNSLFVAAPNSPATVPAELSGFPNPESSNITMKKLQIGSIQSSRQGVVAW
jgi:hypothetical protein